MKNLLGVNIEKEDINKYLQKQGVLVQVHVGRMRNSITISSKTFGIDKENNEELENFFKEHIKEGVIKIIPVSIEKKLVALENKLRVRRKRTAMGYEDSFMTIKQFKKFKTHFEEVKREYFKERDYILEHYSEFIEDFKEKLKKSLTDMNCIDLEDTYETILNKVPSKEDFESSFKMELSVRAFPVIANLDFFEDDIANEIKDSCIKEGERSVYELVGNTISDSFQLLNNMCNSYEDKGKLSPKSKTAVGECIIRLKDKNVFKNAFVNEIISDLSIINNKVDEEEIIEHCEFVLAKSYVFAMDNNLLNYLNLKECRYSKEEFLEIYSLINNDEEN